MSTLLNTTIPTINNTLTAHNGRITTNETEIAKIKNDIITINNNLNTINRTLLEITSKISTLENNYESLENIVTQHTTEINSINSSIEDIETTIADFNTKITNNENAISSINTEMQEINQKIDNLNINEISDLVSQIQNDVTTANNLIEELNNIETASITLDSSITSATNNCTLEKNGKNVRVLINIKNIQSINTATSMPHIIGKISNEKFFPKNTGLLGVGILEGIGDGQTGQVPCLLYAGSNGKITYQLQYVTLDTFFPTPVNSLSLYATFNYFTN